MNSNRRNVVASGGVLAMLAGVAAKFGLGVPQAHAAESAEGKTFAVTHTDDEWKKRLDPAAYSVLRHEGTERPYSSPLNKEHRPGRFACAGCERPLFSSNTKFESGTGWPSFYQPIENAVVEKRDSTFGMVRTEVLCERCGGHLGHVFDDGPKPTGLRYCMNGVAMTFAPEAV
ncbi:MAG: peptide-methionine (R)-S-oxide reductase [Rhizobacter sp.]|nr:peptide-methionine (R)-S-oxide reductase [Rhizobacter sp.]